MRTYENSQKNATGQEDDYTTGGLLDYLCFKKYHKMIAIDLSKQQVLDADPKAIQQINITGNLTTMLTIQRFSLLKKRKKPCKDFSQGTERVL